MDFLDETLRSIGAMDPAPQPATTPQTTPPAPLATTAPADPAHPAQGFLGRLRQKFASAGPMGALLVEAAWEIWQFLQDRRQEDELKTQERVNEAQQATIKYLEERDRAQQIEIDDLRNRLAALEGGNTPTPPPTPTTQPAKPKSRFAI